MLEHLFEVLPTRDMTRSILRPLSTILHCSLSGESGLFTVPMWRSIR